MKAYAAVARVLLERGVDTMFGLMGDQNNLIVAKFFVDPRARYVPVTHESAAVAMADAYSRVGGRLGVATVTHGPGLVNAATALTEAARIRSRVLLITGETRPLHGLRQDVDIRGVTNLTGAGYERVYSADDVVAATDRALQRVMAERRPVVLDLPFDLLHSEAPDKLALSAIPTTGATPGDPTALDNALGLVASANRPVILAGRGAVQANAREALIELADLIGAPLATTLLAREYFRDHPFNLGICGQFSHSVASSVISEADCIVAFGASLNRDTAGASHNQPGIPLFEGKRIVQCDVDPAQFGVFTPVTAPVVGDAGVIAQAMVEGLREAGITKAGTTRSSQLERALAASPSELYEFSDATSGDTVDPRSAIARLDEILPRNRIVVTDCGRHIVTAWRYLRVDDPTCWVPTMLGFGALGLGLAGSIGAAMARPEPQTVVVLGDGGWLLNMAEFMTAVRHHVRIAVVVINDGALGAEYMYVEAFGEEPTSALISTADFALVAEAMGGRGITVRSLKDLDVIADLLPELDGPLLVDIKVDPALAIRI